MLLTVEARRRERDAALAAAERHLPGLGAPVADPVVLDGYALKWDSIATGARGPTRFDPRSFGDRSLKVPLLYQHDDARPIGVVTVTPDRVGLRVQGRISDTALGRDAVALIRDGALTGFSVGFNAKLAHPGPGSVARVIDEAELIEVSLVTFPADAVARVAAVGGQAIPQYHAAAPVEREVATVSGRLRPDLAAFIAEAERETDARLGLARPDPPAVASRTSWLGQLDNPEREDTRRYFALCEHIREWASRPVFGAVPEMTSPFMPERLRVPLRAADLHERLVRGRATWSG